MGRSAPLFARPNVSPASSWTRSLRQSGAVVNEADSEWMANDYGSQTFAETHWRTATECRFDGINIGSSRVGRSARANVGHARLCENFAVALEGKPHGNFRTRSGLAARRRYPAPA